MISSPLHPLRWICLGALVTACAATGGGVVDFGAGGNADARADVRGSSTDRPDTGRASNPEGGTNPPDGGAATDDIGTQPTEDGGGMSGGSDAGSSGGSDGSMMMTACGTREICANMMDDNCNDRVDEDCPCIPGMMQRCYPGDPARAGRGVCTWGMQRCTGDGEFGMWSVCEGHGTPQPVVCGRGMDFRCNGITDEGCECRPGDTRSCYTGPMGTAGVGACRAGMQACAATDGGSAWGMCTGEVRPEADRCDGMDRDCDGNPNSTCACTRGMTRSCYEGPMGTAGVGACRAGMQTCASDPTGMGVAWSRCEGQTVPGRDLCDGLDRDCDGNPNTACTCTLGASRPCYTGPAGTSGVGVCRPGTQTCVGATGGMGTMWGACANEVRPGAMEICGNTLDDNCNGMVNEGCTSACPNGQPLCGSRCCAATEACANNICVGNGLLRFTLTWDTPGDLDLHVVPPCGQEISFRATSACGGRLDRDDIPGTGPENVFWSAAPASGPYHICVNPYGSRSRVTNWVLTANQGTVERRRWTGTRSTAGVGYLRCNQGSTWYVGTFTL